MESSEPQLLLLGIRPLLSYLALLLGRLRYTYYLFTQAFSQEDHCRTYEEMHSANDVCCQHYIVIIILSSLHCQHYIVHIILSTLYCHHYIVIIIFQAFSQEDHCRAHEEMHSANDVCCPHCQKRFLKRGLLNKHLRQGKT